MKRLMLWAIAIFAPLVLALVALRAYEQSQVAKRIAISLGTLLAIALAGGAHYRL